MSAAARTWSSPAGEAGDAHGKNALRRALAYTLLIDLHLCHLRHVLANEPDE